MKNLLTHKNIKQLGSLFHSNAIFAFDFDGTLARIVKDPKQARLNARTVSLIENLNHVVPLAIISGRSKNDLKSRLSFKPKYLIGNHGLEGPYSNTSALRSIRQITKKWKTQLNRLLSKEIQTDSISIEDKTYSLSVHYRRSKTPAESKKQLEPILKLLSPSARIIPGKLVFNIVPQGSPHKGTALLNLMKDTKASLAFYIGDDDTDEDVFKLKDPRIFTVRVGKKSASNAKFYIKEQSEIIDVLKAICENIDSQKKS